MASATGLFDIYDLGWNGNALKIAGINSSKLSKPVPTTYVLKGIPSEYASALGINADTPVIIRRE